MKKYSVAIAIVLCQILAASAMGQNQRETAVRDDRIWVEDDSDWIYNDFERAVTIAGAAKKPVLVVIRCIP